MRASKLALIAAAALGAATFATAPAVGQTYVDEVVVQPPYGPDGPRRLSRAVGYDDLDLTSPEGREVLRLRIRDAAGDLCRALREDPDAHSSIVPTCRQQAIRDARPQVRAAIDRAYARSTYAYLDPDLIP